MEGFKETEIGLLPEDWEVTTIGEVFKFSSGKSRPKDIQQEPLGGYEYPVYGGNGILGYSQEYLFDTQKLIIGRVGEYCGCAHLSKPNSWISDNALYAKEIKRKVDLNFFRSYFSFLNLNQHSNKSGQPLITQGILDRLPIGFPTYKEQQKIFAVVDVIESSIRKQEEIIRTVQELKKSLLHKLFTEGLNGEQQKETEIGMIPGSWEMKSIYEAYDFTKKPRTINVKESAEVPFIPMDLIPDDRIVCSDYILKKGSAVTSGTYVENGDLLLAKITPSFENGKQGILNIPYDWAYATTEVIPIKGKVGISSSLFLFYYLLKEEIRIELEGKMEGSTGRQRLAKATIEQVRIPFPTYKEQEEIGKSISVLDNKINHHTRKKQTLESLFRTLLHELMTGRVRVKDVEM